jgi:hypothetical protein
MDEGTLDVTYVALGAAQARFYDLMYQCGDLAGSIVLRQDEVNSDTVGSASVAGQFDGAFNQVVSTYKALAAAGENLGQLMNKIILGFQELDSSQSIKETPN